MPAHSPCSSSTIRILTFDLSIADLIENRLRRRLGNLRLTQRQHHGKDRPTFWPVSRLDMASMSRDNLLRNPKPKAAAFGFGGKIRIENGGELLEGNSRTIIADLQQDRFVSQAGTDLDFPAA